MKVSELNGAELDYWVAKAERLDCRKIHDGRKVDQIRVYKEPRREKRNDLRRDYQYSPSTDWQQCGELIEKYSVELQTSGDGLWLANVWPVDSNDGTTGNYLCGGETPQIAVCRCVVVSVYGDEVNELD